jgi:hypothetical protein
MIGALNAIDELRAASRLHAGLWPLMDLLSWAAPRDIGSRVVETRSMTALKGPMAPSRG